MAQLSDNCFAFAGALLPVGATRNLICERVGIVAGIEAVALAPADGRRLAGSV